MGPHADTARARLIVLLVPALALAGAYYGQYFHRLYPCEMCWWQRYGHFAALALALLAFVLPAPRGLVALGALALALAALIGGYQAGIEYGWWTGFTACTSDVKFGAGLDPLTQIMGAPLVRCDVVQWSLAGISLAGFDFLWSGAGALAAAALLMRKG